MTFERLAPFIQDYIYRNKWDELREIQVASCDGIFNKDDNLLITTPTASGKTEAAFLPIITEIYNNPSRSVGVLYIAPLKALINDQFIRIEELLHEADIPVTKWHGDASASAKKKLLKNPGGVLQITPESLEAMLMNRKQEILTLFSDLRFVIIDEMHNFIESDRGVQLSSILERIQELTQNTPRRIGLSATVGNINVAEEWLNGGTNRKCFTPKVGVKRKSSRIMVDHFYTLSEKVDEEQKSWIPYYEKLYNLVYGKKGIIFSNSRSEVEQNIVWLKEYAKKKNERDRFLVHHGNISASNREYAEEQMKKSDLAYVIGATVTLELGIDLGDLERVIQTGAPFTVSSMAQRLGRSGRRNSISEMCFLFNEESKDGNVEFYQEINWVFLKCLAIIELYREKWIEPMSIDELPYNVLYHQTMSFIHSNGSVSPGFLAQSMLTKFAFNRIDKDDFKQLLQHMIEKEHLEKLEDGSLITGRKGEFLTNNYNFYSIFKTTVEYSVREGSKEIGTLNNLMPKESNFVLNGKAWNVVDNDEENKIIYVKKIPGKPKIAWGGHDFGLESTKVLKKINEILASNESLPYLSQSASKRLEESRDIISKVDVLDRKIFQLSPIKFGVMLCLGTKALNAFIMWLESKLPACRISIPAQIGVPVIVIFKGVTKGEIVEAILSIKEECISVDDLKLPDEIDSIGKYGDFVPKSLTRKQYVSKFIDIDEMKQELSTWDIFE